MALVHAIRSLRTPMHKLSLILALRSSRAEQCPTTSQPCSSHDGSEAQCFAAALSDSDVAFLKAAFSSSEIAKLADAVSLSGNMRRWHEEPEKPDSARLRGAGESEFVDEHDEDVDAVAAADARVHRRSLPRMAHPRLHQIASRLEALALAANDAGGWGFQLEVGTRPYGTHDGQQAMQFNRYRPGGMCPPHRDAIAAPVEVIPADLRQLPARRERRGDLVQVGRHRLAAEGVYATRMLGVVVQLSNRRGDDDADEEGAPSIDEGDPSEKDDGEPSGSCRARVDHAADGQPPSYGGGALRLRLGTAYEPRLAHRLPGGRVVNVIRSNATALLAPACAGDAVFFTSLTVHEVLPVTSGLRDSLVWWVHGAPPEPGPGTPPGSRIWANRSGFDLALAMGLSL